jgi:GT2 family glycosyltransferase
MYEESDVAYRIRSAGYSVNVVRDAITYHDQEDYMYHFMCDIRLPYVFARNRIIFHSLYSTKLQLIWILLIWIWVFMLFYWYKAFSYKGHGNFSVVQKIEWAFEYLKGNIAGLYFVTRNEKLIYPRVT